MRFNTPKYISMLLRLASAALFLAGVFAENFSKNCLSKSFRICVVGLPKAGTSSLHEAFKRSHISSAHQVYGRKHEVLGVQMYDAVKRGEPLALFFKRVHAFTQMDKIIDNTSYWPQLIFVPLLRAQLPCAKFILNYRNITHHVRSINNWKNLRAEIDSAGAPFLPPLASSSDARLAAWIHRHNMLTRRFFVTQPAAFLNLDIEAGVVANTKKLQRFLGVDVQLGHANSNPALRRTAGD